MSAGQIIGRVAVKVSPDTRDFKREAERQLDRIEQQLDNLKVSTKIDMSGASREFVEELRKINRRNKQMDARKIRFFTTISTDGMATAVRNAARELQQRASTQRVKFTVSDLKATGKIELELDQQSADKAKRKLKDWADDVSPLKVKVEPDIANGSGAALAARLQLLTRPRTVPILPELDNGAVARVATALAALSGARVLNSMFERLGRTLKNLDKSVPVIGSLALAIAGLAGWGLSAASNLAALSASLAQIGATSLLLPGLLGGMVVGLGVTIAAFKDFNKVVPEVKAALSGLQDTISANFWKKAAEPIRAVVDDLLPRFRDGVAQTATELGGFFGSFATNLGTALSPALGQMFADLSGSIAVATAGTDTFASIIATLGQVGTSYLPALAGWFVQISEQFDSFLKRKGEAGLKAEIDEGIQALQDLGSVLYNTGGILAGVARAAEAAGGSSLGTLAGTLERIHATVDSPGFQEGLTGVFVAAHEAMNQIATISGPAVKQFFIELGQLAETILPQVGTIIGTALEAVASALAQPAVTDGVTAMFDGIQAAVQSLAPAMAPIGAALGTLMTVVGAFASMLGPLVSAALVPLAQAFTALAPAVIPIIALLGGALTGVLQQLAPILAQLVPVIGAALGVAFSALAAILPPVAQLFTTIMTAVAPLVASLIEGLAPILPLLASAFSAIVTAVTPVVSLLFQLVSAVITPLIPLVEYIVSACLPPLVDAFKRVSEAVQPFLQALIQVVNFIMPVLVPALKFVADFIIGSLAMALDGIVLVITGVLDVIMGVWEVFAGIFTGDWDRAWQGIKQIFGGIWDMIVGLFEIVINIGIFGVLKKGMALIKALWTGGWGVIKTFFIGIWDAIKGGLGLAWTAVRSYIDDGLRSLRGTWSSGWNAIKQFFIDAWNSIKEKAVSGARSLWEAIKDGVEQSIKFVRELPGKAKEALSDLGSTLVSAGKELIKGLIRGITSMFGGVKESLGSLTDKLKDWKGPPKKDRVLLTPAGKLIIRGFVKGLESEYGSVRRSLSGLTASIPDAGSLLGDRASRDRDGLRSLASQWDAGAKELGSARDRLDEVLGQAVPAGAFTSDGAAKAVRALTARPSVSEYSGAARTLAVAVSGGLGNAPTGGTTKVLNYYAASGTSLSSEEELFAATHRARMVGW
ncbi:MULTISPECIES: phage tail protein [Streptomyces]|uniref:phage tail protein n=1 Tax=Streptomyces TaxID=1883 RepID=UPI002271D16B|nr:MULTISPECIES: hypothetical protein [unclassified Streptomyces]MCY0921661.1 hypothetical protein [Streptomyces sp. H27-G5]MCY0943994.1 hypothetical protein [Streptomyces sp. H34-AA3]MCY0956286.1 hypothetical protein [Streptomyces sp. H27-H5]MCZ4082306.1 hypothetical protein [Streptomyces sp. H34-S5]